MSGNDAQHHPKLSHNMLDKLSHKISAIKEDISEAVRVRRSRSFSSDRHHSMSPTSSLARMNSVALSLQDNAPSITVQIGQSSKTSGKSQLQTLTYGSHTFRP
jgi:hypothetical protein